MIASLSFGKRGNDIYCRKTKQTETGGYDYLKERRCPAYIVKAMQFIDQVALSNTI